MAKIGEQIRVMLEAREARQDEIQSVVGRIVNVRALVPDGRFHMHHLLSLVAVSELGRDLVELTGGFKRQLHFWYVMLRACSGKVSIPAPAEDDDLGGRLLEDLARRMLVLGRNC